MHVLVMGGTVLLGRETVLELLRRGHREEVATTILRPPFVLAPGNTSQRENYLLDTRAAIAAGIQPEPTTLEAMVREAYEHLLARRA